MKRKAIKDSDCLAYCSSTFTLQTREDQRQELQSNPKLSSLHVHQIRISVKEFGIILHCV